MYISKSYFRLLVFTLNYVFPHTRRLDSEKIRDIQCCHVFLGALIDIQHFTARVLNKRGFFTSRKKLENYLFTISTDFH